MMLRSVRAISAKKKASLVTQGLLWFDMSDTSTMTFTGNRVDEWRDKQGSGAKLVTNTTASNPTRDATMFGGKGGFASYVSSVGKFLITPSGSTFPLNWNTGWTILAVVKHTSRDGYGLAEDFMGGTQVQLTGVALCERVGVGSASAIPLGLPRNTACVIGTTYAGGSNSNTNWRFILDEKSYPQNPGQVQSGYTAAFDRLKLGGTGGNLNAFQGEVAGFFLWPRVLTANELASSVRWIKNFYAIGNPVLTPSFTIAIDGNSLAAGFNTRYSNGMYEGALLANGAPSQKDIRYFSLGAQTTQQLASRAAGLIDPYYSEASEVAANRKILMFWEGSNDLVLNAINSTQCYNNIKTYCQARKAVGWKVVITTLLPRNTAVSGFETNRLAVNASIRANAISEGWADAVADVGNDATIGQTGQYTNTTYYNADGVHLNDTGYAFIRPYFTNAINSITGL